MEVLLAHVYTSQNYSLHSVFIADLNGLCYFVLAASCTNPTPYNYEPYIPDNLST